MNRRLNEIEDNEIFVRQEKMMPSSFSSDSLLRAKEVVALARSQRHTSSSSPKNSNRRTRNTPSYEPHTAASTLTRQQRKEKETAMLLEEIMIVKQKILTGMKNSKTENAG